MSTAVTTDNTRVFTGLIQTLRTHKGTDDVRSALDSGGDVTRVEGYATLSACISQLRALEAGGKSLGPALRTAADAQAALLEHRPAFQAAFGRGGSESVRYIYASAVLALWATVSLLCVEGVTFTPSGQSGNYMPNVNHDAAIALTSSLPVARLTAFVTAAKGHGFAAVLTSSAPEAEKEILGEAWGVTVLLGLAALLILLYLARDIAAWIYERRGASARWLDAQATFLAMNAASLDPSKHVARERQEEYVHRLRMLADRIRVDAVDAEHRALDATRENDRSLAAPPAGAAAGLI
jgi:hypothetical protein